MAVLKYLSLHWWREVATNYLTTSITSVNRQKRDSYEHVWHGSGHGSHKYFSVNVVYVTIFITVSRKKMDDTYAGFHHDGI